MSASVWNPNAENLPVADAGDAIFKQDFTATAAQTLFTLTVFSYSAAANALWVFKNGTKLRLTEDYTETSATSFTLTSGATVGDEITALGFAGVTSVVGMIWRGAYSAGTAYIVNDVVSSGGSTYICILPSTGNLPTDTTYWSVVAAKGDSGPGSGNMLAANNLSDVATAATSRTNLGAAKSGANSDITSLTACTEITGLTTALSIAQGGTAATTAAAARTSLDIKELIALAVSDEVTSITAGVAKLTFRMPYAFTLLEIRASLTTASTSGVPTFDINEKVGAGAVTSILSTKLTIDANELTSTTAATPAVISDASLADDSEITVDIDAAGTGAKGLKIYLIGRRT